MNRGQIWRLGDGRDVLIVSLTGLETTYGGLLVLVLHPPDRYPDTAMSVTISEPVPCTAVAINLMQMRVGRFDGAELLGEVGTETMARVGQALRAVLDLDL
ncbi:hypothetical protein ACSCBZ_46765 [Streptomyces niveiscabiei]|uniref:hypothetical protein n=1 Tax=Streptomyces niveiscabiei TaxID=164115 RepID=UPI0006EB8C12|nr:hypothetical protein [Streptomyces niveiscabiei]